MSRDTPTPRRRAVLLAGAAGVSSMAGCLDTVLEPIEDETGGTQGTETSERRIQENSQGTGSIPLVRFAVRSDAWVGVGPEGFSDVENPPMTLQAGDDYEILWENLDGERHEFVVANADGDELASTDPAEEYAEVRSMVITANDDMDHYHCPDHSDAERGNIRIT